ncbi:MAG: ABC transporter permease [Bacillati bacterium ANGP1]|uniref:ABC transporter permease n=1 Tax=Candidatus Segetimicrobium genomatis TaxID=2569760 RepID=A0A537JZP2_9BACT|nr:MAG: ABC transporter permease [Terrabacteria group bacterium ANGP1]
MPLSRAPRAGRTVETGWHRTLRRFRRNPLSVLGAVIIAFFVVLALLAPFLAHPTERNPFMIPHSGYASDPHPPGPGHPFGTTEEQFDLYYGVIWGSRTAFVVALSVVATAVVIALLLGSISGYYGGPLDELVMRVTDIFLAFPHLILAVVIVAVLGQSVRNAVIAIAVVEWPTYTRLLRGEFLRVRDMEYVQAARALGGGDPHIIARHVIPNTIYPMLILASLNMGGIVITFAALSFLGLGAPIGYADWGQLISLSHNWIVGTAGDPFTFWYTLIVPGTAIFLFVLGWNLLGDAFRDVFDPRLQGSR